MKALLNPLKTLKTRLATALRPNLRVEVVQGDFDPKADHVVADMVLAGFGHAVIIPSRSLYNVEVSPRKMKYSAAEFREIARQLNQHALLEMLEFRICGIGYEHAFHASCWDDEEAKELSQPGAQAVFLQDVAPTR